MRIEGGLGEPLLYAIIGGSIGVIVWFLFSLGLNSLGVLTPRETGFAPMLGMTVSLMVLVWRLVAVAVVPFVFGGLVHLSLMLIGDAKQNIRNDVSRHRVFARFHRPASVGAMLRWAGCACLVLGGELHRCGACP